MLLNYLKIIIRNISKNKVFTIIQIAGLSIGICIVIVIAMLVKHEFSYDTFHNDSDRIHRIVSKSKFDGEEFPNSGVPAPLAEAVRSDISGLDLIVPFHLWGNVNVVIKQEESVQKSFKNENDIIFAPPEFFNLFSYEWLAGSAINALEDPYKVVLTKSKVKKYFPDINNPNALIGKTILYNDSIETTISGIVEDFPGLTDFTFAEFISIATINKTNLKEEFYMDAWDNISSSSQLIVKLDEGVNAKSINAQFPVVLEKYLDPSNDGQSHELQPLKDIHFNVLYDNFDKRSAHKPTLYGLLLLSFFLLILACINYINLTTAQSSTRKKEISIRKTFGSSKKQLIRQFLGESIAKVAIATIFSISALPFIFSHFADFLPPELDYNKYLSIFNILILLIFIVMLGMMSGIYPAFALAAFKPVWLLQGKTSAYQSRQYLRQGLIVFQFATAFCLIIGSFTISKQIKFGLTKDLGYQKEAILNIPFPWRSDYTQKKQFFQKLHSISEIDKISLGGEPPASESTLSRTIEFQNKTERGPILAEFKYGDPAYLAIYNLNLIAGSRLSPSDTLKEIIINQAFVRELGYNDPQDLIGQIVKINEKERPIIGVVTDFHSKSMHQMVKPLVIASDNSQYNVAHIKLFPQSENWQFAIVKAEAVWNEVFPNEVFNYDFFDDKIAAFYDNEVKLNMLLNWATGIAIFISCLGLIGLVSFNIQQRTKEIGIRKILGASLSSILMLLSKSFFKLTLIAFAFAAHVGYYLIKVWLENFSYKIEIQWWLFVLPGLVVLGISVLVLSVQSIKAALANPVDSLKSE